MRADRPMLTKIGILYNSQSSLNLTPTKKIMLSVINSLCAGRFADEHDGFISLNEDQIADRTCGWFSARQVGRHISDLIEKGILMSYFSEGKRWVGLKSGKASAGKFMTVVSITTDQNLFCASEILILSKLLDRAAFHYRAGVGLVTDKVFMKNLQDGLYPMCIRSIRQGLGKLKAKGLLSYVEESSSSLMPVVFSEAVTSQYVSLLRLKPSEKCRKLVYKQAVERLLRSEKASELTVTVKEERATRAEERVRDERAEKLRAFSARHSQEYIKRQMGKRLEILVENGLEGTTGNYLKGSVLLPDGKVPVRGMIYEGVMTSTPSPDVFKMRIAA